MTGENFPDVYLLAYQQSWCYSLLFIVFVVLTMFYMESIILSIVFDNYKKRIEEISERKLDERLGYINMYYDSFDVDQLGYLDYKQAREFFSQVLDLNMKKHSHMKTFLKILKIVDPEGYKIVSKELILGFFSISGFTKIADLGAEQSRLKRALKNKHKK